MILNIVYETQKCTVMFEGYDTQETVNFDDVEPFEASLLLPVKNNQVYRIISFVGRIL